MKIHDLFIRHFLQAALGFNINYRALRLLQKVLNMNYQSWNVGQSTPSMGLIVTFSQFYLKLNNLFVRWYI